MEETLPAVPEKNDFDYGEKSTIIALFDILRLQNFTNEIFQQKNWYELTSTQNIIIPRKRECFTSWKIPALRRKTLNNFKNTLKGAIGSSTDPVSLFLQYDTPT